MLAKLWLVVSLRVGQTEMGIAKSSTILPRWFWSNINSQKPRRIVRKLNHKSGKMELRYLILVLKLIKKKIKQWLVWAWHMLVRLELNKEKRTKLEWWERKKFRRNYGGRKIEQYDEVLWLGHMERLPRGRTMRRTLRGSLIGIKWRGRPYGCRKQETGQVQQRIWRDGEE